MGLWTLSLLAAIGTGWLVFGRGVSGLLVHTVFLLSVCGFVVCSFWVLARVFSRESGLDQNDPKGETGHNDDPRSPDS